MAACCIPETILSALTKKLYLVGQLWSGLFLGQACSSLQDPSGFCKDPTSKLNRDMLGTTMTASLRVALISAITLQGYTVFFTTLVGGGQFQRVPAWPSMLQLSPTGPMCELLQSPNMPIPIIYWRTRKMSTSWVHRPSGPRLWLRLYHLALVCMSSL